MNPLEHPDKPLNDVPREQPIQPKQEPPLAAVPIAPPASSAEPIQKHDYAQPIADAPKKAYHPRRFMVALGVFVTICLLAVTAMVAMALLPMQQSKKSETANNAASQAVEKTVSAKQAIAHVKEYFKADGAAKSGISLPVRATGKDFYTVIPDAASLQSVAGEVMFDKIDAQLASVIHSLEGDGFTLLASGYEPERLNYLGSFTHKETFCQVEVVRPADTKANQWLEVRCADMATYDEYAKAQEPLARLYTPLSATSVLYGFVGKPTATASKTGGYYLTELPVSIVLDNTMISTGNAALFYQTPNQIWRYFKDRDADTAFDCGDYNTDDLRYAYAGTPCRNSGKSIPPTVQPPKKT